MILNVLSVCSRDSVTYSKAQTLKRVRLMVLSRALGGRVGGCGEGGVVPKRRASLLNGLCRVNVPH